jgi:hypothetical protein
VHRWPDTGGVLLPYALAACAAGAGFLMDECAAAVVRVTARGGAWRVLARSSALLLPVALWTVLVIGLPAAATTQRGTLLLAGAAGCLLAAGAAAAAARAGATAPGTHLAAAAVGLTTVPFVLGGFLGWDPVVPVHDAAVWVGPFWVVVGVLALACSAVGLRRTP